MAELQIQTEVSDDTMPDLPVNRTGQWTEAVRTAAEDGKVRVTRGIPEGDTMDRIRRQLSHTAGALKTEKYPDGAGVITRVQKDDKGAPVLYWQVTEKRVRSESSGTSTPDGAGASANGGGSGPTPGKAQGAAKAARTAS